MWPIPIGFGLVILLDYCRVLAAVQCYKCESRIGELCDEQNFCNGAACINLEKVVDGERSVSKGCSEHVRETKCIYTEDTNTGAQLTRCTCLYDLCNGEQEIRSQGLMNIGSGSATQMKVTKVPMHPMAPFHLTINHVFMLVFFCLFLTASFSLLLMNTVCVHLC